MHHFALMSMTTQLLPCVMLLLTQQALCSAAISPSNNVSEQVRLLYNTRLALEAEGLLQLRCACNIRGCMMKSTQKNDTVAEQHECTPEEPCVVIVSSAE